MRNVAEIPGKLADQHVLGNQWMAERVQALAIQVSELEAQMRMAVRECQEYARVAGSALDRVRVIETRMKKRREQDGHRG